MWDRQIELESTVWWVWLVHGKPHRAWHSHMGMRKHAIIWLMVVWGVHSMRRTGYIVFRLQTMIYFKELEWMFFFFVPEKKKYGSLIIKEKKMLTLFLWSHLFCLMALFCVLSPYAANPVNPSWLCCTFLYIQSQISCWWSDICVKKKRKKKKKTLDQGSPTWCPRAPGSPQGPHE